jgi:enolase
LKIAIEKAGYTGKIKIAMDVAASGNVLNYLF